MPLGLVVHTAFADYSVGDVIADGDKVTELRDRRDFVTPVALPDLEPRRGKAEG